MHSRIFRVPESAPILSPTHRWSSEAVSVLKLSLVMFLVKRSQAWLRDLQISVFSMGNPNDYEQNHSLREKPWVLWEFCLIHRNSRCAVLPGLMQGVGEQRSHWVFADVLGPQLMRNPFHPVAMGWWDCQVSWMSQDQWDRLGAAWVRLGPKSWYCISFVAAFQSISSHPFQNCYLPLNRIYRYTYNMIYTYTRHT